MVFCDPPYGVNYGATMKDKLRGKSHRKIVNDNLGDAFGLPLRCLCQPAICRKGAIYICMSSSELHTLEKAFREAGGHWSTFVIWAKNTFTMGRSDYQPSTNQSSTVEGRHGPLLVRCTRPGDVGSSRSPSPTTCIRL